MRIRVLLTFLAVAASFAALAIPLILRRVPRNPLLGLRTFASMSSDYVWMEANALTGRLFAWLAGIVALAAVTLYFINAIPDMRYLFGLSVMLLAGSLAIGARGWWFARRLAREETAGS